MSEDIGMTKVLALMRPNAARKSPPVCRLTSPRCHFHAMHSKSVWGPAQTPCHTPVALGRCASHSPSQCRRLGCRSLGLQPRFAKTFGPGRYVLRMLSEPFDGEFG